jgi:hypothetical protein
MLVFVTSLQNPTAWSPRELGARRAAATSRKVTEHEYAPQRDQRVH